MKVHLDRGRSTESELEVSCQPETVTHLVRSMSSQLLRGPKYFLNCEFSTGKKRSRLYHERRYIRKQNL